jgi:hypothetical protein
MLEDLKQRTGLFIIVFAGITLLFLREQPVTAFILIIIFILFVQYLKKGVKEEENKGEKP